MSIEKCGSPFFKGREDLNRAGPHGGILRSLRTLGFFSDRRAIDIKVLTDLKRGCFSAVAQSGCNARWVLRWRVFFCCLKQDFQDEQDEQDESGLGAAALDAAASPL